MGGHKFKSGKRGRPPLDATCITCGVIWSKHEAPTSPPSTTQIKKDVPSSTIEVGEPPDEDAPTYRDITPLTPDEQTAIDEYLERLHPGFINRRTNGLQRV